jgi:hypothetical protein
MYRSSINSNTYVYQMHVMLVHVEGNAENLLKGFAWSERGVNNVEYSSVFIFIVLQICLLNF